MSMSTCQHRYVVAYFDVEDEDGLDCHEIVAVESCKDMKRIAVGLVLRPDLRAEVMGTQMSHFYDWLLNEGPDETFAQQIEEIIAKRDAENGIPTPLTDAVAELLDKDGTDEALKYDES